jgi:hypothetical protein
MATAIWAAGASLLGVVIGGCLSLLVQWRADRSASLRYEATIRESRRVEKLTYLINFLEISQEAERLAVSQHRPSRADPEWAERIVATLDQLWKKLRAVQLLCPDSVRDEAYDYTWRIHAVLREGLGDKSNDWQIHAVPGEKPGDKSKSWRTCATLEEAIGDKSVAKFLHDGRHELIGVARKDLGPVDVEQTMGLTAPPGDNVPVVTDSSQSEETPPPPRPPDRRRADP